MGDQLNTILQNPIVQAAIPIGAGVASAYSPYAAKGIGAATDMFSLQQAMKDKKMQREAGQLELDTAKRKAAGIGKLDKTLSDEAYSGLEAGQGPTLEAEKTFNEKTDLRNILAIDPGRVIDKRLNPGVTLDEIYKLGADMPEGTTIAGETPEGLKVQRDRPVYKPDLPSNPVERLTQQWHAGLKTDEEFKKEYAEIKALEREPEKPSKHWSETASDEIGIFTDTPEGVTFKGSGIKARARADEPKTALEVKEKAFQTQAKVYGVLTKMTGKKGESLDIMLGSEEGQKMLYDSAVEQAQTNPSPVIRAAAKRLIQAAQDLYGVAGNEAGSGLSSRTNSLIQNWQP
jgi:hypothetical protein